MPQKLKCISLSDKIFTSAIGLIVFPFTNVGISTCKDEPPESMRLIVFPVAFIYGAIHPYLDAPSTPILAFPLALVCIERLKENRPFLCGLRVFKLFSIKDKISQILLY